jgi:hypothetical protein
MLKETWTGVIAIYFASLLSLLITIPSGEWLNLHLKWRRYLNTYSRNVVKLLLNGRNVSKVDMLVVDREQMTEGWRTMRMEEIENASSDIKDWQPNY